MTYKKETAEPSRPDDGDDAEGVFSAKCGANCDRRETEERTTSDTVEYEVDGEDAD